MLTHFPVKIFCEKVFAIHSLNLCASKTDAHKVASHSSSATHLSSYEHNMTPTLSGHLQDHYNTRAH